MAPLKRITTIGQAIEYTFNTRHTWRHGSGAATAKINTNHFIRIVGRSFPLNKINQQQMNLVCMELEDEGMSDSTINRVISAISTVLNHLAFDGIIDAAPRFRRRKEGEHRIRFYSKEEVEAMATAARDIFDRIDLHDIILVAAYTGMRQAELRTLKACDIDLTRNMIHVGGREGFQTKAKNYRAVPIHNRIRRIIEDRVQNSPLNTQLFGKDWSSKDQLYRAFVKVRNYIGKGDDYCFHSLRHSFASWSVEGDVNIKVIQSLLGHKRIETTLRYAHTSDKALHDSVLKI